MVRPARFGFNEETAGNNHFQRKTETGLIAEKAVEEFDAFVKLLRGNDVDVTVIQDTIDTPTPDSIFPNNWFSSHITGELVLYPMFAENRRQERKPDIMRILRRRMNHKKVINLTSWETQGAFLEGTGSMVLDRDKRIAYCCRSVRTSEKVLADFCARMSFDAVVFDAIDKSDNPIYHTNVMMALGNQLATVCLEAVEDEKERNRLASRLLSSGKIIVDISREQVEHFSGNMLELKSRNGNPLMVMSASARNALTMHQENVISTYTKIVSTKLDTIETTGGGSARCMIAEIFV